MGEILLSVENLSKHFQISKGVILKKVLAEVQAVDNVFFKIIKGQTMGLVGESGSGKTTLGKLAVRLLDPTSGKIIFKGKDITQLNREELREIRSKMGVIFQDPFSSLDPRKSISQIIGEPMRIHGIGDGEQRVKRICELLERVGLRKDDRYKYPHQFSGGQRQRVAIARALALSPDLIIADEAVSALDVSVQAKIINLLVELQKEFDLTYIFIAHDLSVVRQVSDTVAVMYLGKIIEMGPVDEIFANPLHPYTHALMRAIPVPDPDLMKKNPPEILKGEIPSPLDPPKGCRFHTRCPHAKEACSQEVPELEDVGSNHFAACHFWKEIKEKSNGQVVPTYAIHE